ncbi:Glycosyltransferase involved in cell wall bisynthesis [Butyrivibrio fibrisolvens DSM 3071]|uniref:Glycosyltransferase involved in cell wall bisynthesis n=1 Tax=Butyrivibrio fibrisolvens DSM 3071 TaxID=1121131 RepID=A0A1M6FMY5_BUTFI|nr:glycosyltransferase family 4 protein [Butyrivibrio fibrisolvens]SHI99071.1 Glycosyltransferase involved in cell wall bisynthesis [Butyrivibrio fibrisolvens DSM 3071]
MKGKVLYIKNSSSKVNLNTYNVQAVGLGRAFCELGYDYDFVFFSNEEKVIQETDIAGCKLRIITKKGIRLLRSYICPSVLDKDYLEGYDLVISTEYGQIMTYLLSKKASNVVLYSGPYYNLFKIPFVSPFYDLLFTKSINSRCIRKYVKSELAKEYLEKKGYTELKKLGVGLDITRFDTPIEMQPSTKELVDVMSKSRCLLYVGSLSKRKNFPFLLQVYERVVEKNSDVKFVIIGKGDEKYVQRHLKKVSKQAQSGIIRMESIDNVQLQFIYPLAKAFLLPSKLEIFGMVLLEAMYLGAPVITSWNGGSSVLINEKNTGKIVNKFDVDQWAITVQKYLDDEGYVKEVTDNARTLIKKEYLWNVLAKKILAEMND